MPVFKSKKDVFSPVQSQDCESVLALGNLALLQPHHILPQISARQSFLRAAGDDLSFCSEWKSAMRICLQDRLHAGSVASNGLYKYIVHGNNGYEYLLCITRGF
jgi:hypothetical protein